MPTTLEPSTRLARAFHAFSDPTRLQIIELLEGGERCVCELTGALDVAQSRLSFHLRVLKEAGMVSDRRRGRWIYYTLMPAPLHELADHLTAAAQRAARAGSAGLTDAHCCA
jgi:ArsR family transcriptional regulator